MKKVNKKDLVETVADEGHLSKRDARVAVDIVFDLIEQSLLDGQEVNISNFGVFTPVKRHQRVGTHPKTHKHMEIKEKNSVSFRLSRSLKRKINK